MGLVNGSDLIEAGWSEGPDIGRALAKAAELEARGVHDRAYILKLVARDVPKTKPRLENRAEPAPLAEAIQATCEADEQNLEKVRRLMADLLRTPVIERGAIMPDACPAGHAPATIPVGGAIAVRNAIIPSAHSADICCSMFATFFTCEKEVAAMLDDLTASTRFGGGGRRRDDLVHHPVLEEEVLYTNPFLDGLREAAVIHMADQGDGNHFAYIGRLEVTPELTDALSAAGYGEMAGALSGHGHTLVLVTHHGSRGLGAKLYVRGQKAARKATDRIARDIPDAAAWLDFREKEGADYWEALQYVSRWTRANHESIHERFLERSGGTRVTSAGNEHNFVWKRGEDFLHGKGATPAWRDEEGRPLLGLIPLNMAEPILLVLGRDNPEFMGFAPHGAGRNLSRSALMRDFKNADGEVDEKRVATSLAHTTAGLDIRWFHGKSDLSESPIGYKPAAQVKAQIAQFGLADVVAEITPLGCIMAGDSGPPPWIKRKLELSPKQLRAIEHRADRRKEHQRLKSGALPVEEEGEE